MVFDIQALCYSVRVSACSSAIAAGLQGLDKSQMSTLVDRPLWHVWSALEGTRESRRISVPRRAGELRFDSKDAANAGQGPPN